MSVTLIGPNGLFTRLGKLFYVLDITHQIVTTTQSFQYQLDQELEDAANEYNVADARMLLGLYDDSVQIQTATAATIVERIRQTTVETIIQMTNDDVTLPSLSLPAALRELIRQMEDAGESLEPNTTITNVVPNAQNVGDGVALVSYRFGAGAPNDRFQYNRVETMRLQCTGDAQVSGSTGRETFALEGENAIASTANPGFPGGSGIGETIRASDPLNEGRGPGRNRVSNGAFERWTGDTPDDWTLAPGITPGTDVVRETTLQRRDSSALRINGDGLSIGEFLTSAAFALRPDTHYTIGFFTRRSPGLSAGSWELEVRDGGLNVAAAASTSAGSVSDSAYGIVSAEFRTPNEVANNYAAGIKVTAALDASEYVLIDGLFVMQTPQYGGPNGPFLLVTPGSSGSNWIRGDLVNVGSVRATVGKFQTYLDMMLGLNQLVDEQSQSGRGFTFPFADAATIPDNLIS